MSRVMENLTHGSMGGGRNLASVGSDRAMLAPPAYPTVTTDSRRPFSGWRCRDRDRNTKTGCGQRHQQHLQFHACLLYAEMHALT